MRLAGQRPPEQVDRSSRRAGLHLRPVRQLAGERGDVHAAHGLLLRLLRAAEADRDAVVGTDEGPPDGRSRAP
eukprot:7424871-Alexandrium_andersonii.AAC.1